MKKLITGFVVAAVVVAGVFAVTTGDTQACGGPCPKPTKTAGVTRTWVPSTTPSTTPTATSTQTPTNTPTLTPTQTSTATPEDTSTSTATTSATSTSSSTSTPTSTPTLTKTAVPETTFTPVVFTTCESICGPDTGSGGYLTDTTTTRRYIDVSAWEIAAIGFAAALVILACGVVFSAVKSVRIREE